MGESRVDRWFQKIAYTKVYLYGYLLIVVSSIVALVFIFNQTERSDVSTISVDHFKNKFLEREAFMMEFFNPYITSIHAVAESRLLTEYFEEGGDSRKLGEFFLTVKKSLPCVFQVRLIDREGMEKVRVEGTPVDLFKERAVSTIVPEEALQQKADRDYVRQFLKLAAGELGISKIDLNIEHGETESPKKPTVRLGRSIYDARGVLRGILVYNICLKTFFQQLDKTTLYTVHLVDAEGRYLINNHPGHGGIAGEKFDTYTIADEYGAEAARQILRQEEYFGGDFYTHVLRGFDNGQKLRMILDLKFGQISEADRAVRQRFLVWAIALALVLLPVIYLFARVPEAMKRRINRTEFSDERTGLPNRRSLFKHLQEQTFGDAIIILIHLNNYVKIQNIYGYEIASELIEKAARFIKAIRDRDVLGVYRYSDDGFALKYRYSDIETLNGFLQKVHLDLENTPFVVEQDLELLLDVTMGVSDPEKLNNSLDELKEAEVALERALEQKYDYAIYDFEHLYGVERNRENLDIAKSIKKAIENGGMELHFQPIMNNVLGTVEKYETLMRLRNGDTLLYPDSFIPIAKELKKYKRLTQMLVEKACVHFRELPFDFSINLSAEDIYDEGFGAFFFAKIDEHGVGSRLVVEIVESESIRDYEYFYQFVRQVKEAGCKVAIDDFGSGYSNFQYLIAMSDYIDYVKIDGSLIQKITTDPTSQLVVGSIKAMCDRLSIRTIAEYVENREIQSYLCDAGIDYSQGYFIGRPEKHI